jgi:hypothetical protein
LVDDGGYVTEGAFEVVGAAGADPCVGDGVVAVGDTSHGGGHGTGPSDADGGTQPGGGLLHSH